MDWWKVVLAIVLALVASVLIKSVVDGLSPVVTAGSTALSSGQTQLVPTTGALDYSQAADSVGDRRPAASTVIAMFADALIGPGNWAMFKSWLTGVLVTLLLLAIGWQVWKAVAG